MSDVITREDDVIITRDEQPIVMATKEPLVTASTVQVDCSECDVCSQHPNHPPPKANPLSFLQSWNKPTKSQILYFNSSTLQVATTGDNSGTSPGDAV